MDSAGFAFTSGRAEAMCKASPPSVRLRSKALASPAPVCSPAKPKDRPQHPRLNFDDLPEAALPGGREHLGRCGRPAPGRLRVKSLGLPSCEEDPEAEAREREAAGLAEAEDQQWSCPACTFLNCGLLSACELCQTEKGASPPSGLPEPVPASSGGWPSLTSAQGDESPSLEEAAESWVDCDVSSVASSWLDVDCADACLVDDDAGAFVVPPLARRALAARQARQERQARREDEADPELLDLEDRRLRPRTSRGAAHRMRMQRQYG